MPLSHATLKSILNPRSALSILWESIVWLIIIAYLLPGTIVSNIITGLTLVVQGRLGLLASDGFFRSYDLACSVGYLLLILLSICLLFINKNQSYSALCAKSVVLFIGLYVVSFFSHLHSTSPDSSFFDEALWPCLTFGVFLAISLFFDTNQCIRLINLVICVITLQSFYGVLYHFLHVHQFHTPRFGDRTSGTLGNPGLLYPLCLMGIPLSLSFSLWSRSKAFTISYLLASACMTIALTFTYMRSGWLALSCSLLWMANTSLFKKQEQMRFKRLLIAFALVYLAGACVVRTPGSYLGSEKDRSFWGRTAIWQVAFKSIQRHPILGTGLNSYKLQQNTYITRKLHGFNPQNVDAESLPLNICVEFGFIGFFLFGHIIWRFIRLSACIDSFHNMDQMERAFTIGMTSGLIGILVSGLFDTPILTDRQTASTLTLCVLTACLYVFMLRHENRESLAAFPDC